MRRAVRAYLLLPLLAAAPLAATEVKIFQTQTQAGFLAGTLEGVSADSAGSLELAPKAERLTALSEPFLLAAAVHPDGWVVGTGNAGRVLRIDRRGNVTELFAAPEPEVFAVWADADGTVFAGTSPRGKVYRIPAEKAGGKPEVFFDPGETYIWKLARAADGSLLVATGTQGKLFKVDARGRGEVLYDSEDTHIRALLPLPGGDLLLGTAGEGLILRLGKDGQARTLHDAAQPEVVALAAAPDGTCYAAVIASEASLVDPARGATAAAGPPTGAAKPKSEPTAVVTVVEGDDAAGKSDFKGPRSEVLSLSPAGIVESLWSFAEETVYDLLWQDRLWVSTGLEGKLYSFSAGHMLLEKDTDERQVVALLPGQPGPAFATTNAAALYRVTAGTERTGTYTSAALDAGQVARFGTFRWRGETPGGSSLAFSFRSGVSAEPDRTWSPWTRPRQAHELAAEVPIGRYVQWRAEMKDGNGTSPRLYAAELSYRQENLKPRIEGFVALDPGQILVPSNFNPSNQVYEPAHPNREGIFTTLALAEEADEGRLKPLWKKGFRSLRWKVSDPNEDKLLYALSFRPAAAAGGDWLPMASELKDEYYSFDATVLPDGVYRFRLTASDLSGNAPEEALTAEEVSEPVVVDHTPPVLASAERAERAERDSGAVRVRVTDASSPIREAVYSLDAAEWKPAKPADGLMDGQSETLSIDAAGAPGGLLLLRVTDAAYNVVTFDLSPRAEAR